MLFKTVVVGPLGVNCSILGCEREKKGIVVDPGGDVASIISAVEGLELSIVAIINTHGHFDHVGGNSKIKSMIDAPLYIHKEDAPMLGRVSQVAGMYGMVGENSPPADVYLEDGQIIDFGSCRLKVIHTPGHTPGGCCLYIETEQKLISGDTLFADGVGRTDLPGGSHQQLVASIREKLFVLPDEVEVFPGHGPSTTIGYEKQHNPYLE